MRTTHTLSHVRGDQWDLCNADGTRIASLYGGRPKVIREATVRLRATHRALEKGVWHPDLPDDNDRDPQTYEFRVPRIALIVGGWAMWTRV